MLSLPQLPRNLEAAFRDLASKKIDVRRGAVLDVVKHGLADEGVRLRAATELVKLLQGDPSGQVRASACVGLADLGAESALAALCVAVEDEDAFVRQMALSALGEIGDLRACGRVERALTDERPELRYQAVIAFSRLSSQSRQPTQPNQAHARGDLADLRRVLANAAKDKDESVRYIAVRLMEEAFQRDGASFLDATIKDCLDASLQDDHLDVVLAGALFMLRLGEGSRLREARAVIAAVVRDAKWSGQVPNKEDEGAAVELAGELGMKELVPDLLRRAFGLKRLVADSCSFHAKIALARLGHERAVTSILADLGSRSLETRTLAVVAAGRAQLASAAPYFDKLEGRVDAQLLKDARASLAARTKAAEQP